MTAVVLPVGYEAWERWRQAGGHPSERPRGLPYGGHGQAPIPRTWRALYQQRQRQQPKPPPVGVPQVMAFTAWDPHAALRLPAAVDVCVTTDNGWCTLETANLLRAAGHRVAVWEATPTLGQAAVNRVGAVEWCGQAENEDQAQASLRLLDGLTVPASLVGNPGAWTAETRGKVSALVTAGKLKLRIEDYWNVEPWMPPSKVDSKGVPPWSFVFGLYDATAEREEQRIPVTPDAPARRAFRDYVADLPAGIRNVDLYLVEALTGDDIATVWRLHP